MIHSTLRRLLTALAGTSLLAWGAAGAQVQGYPNKPVTALVAFPAGGGHDFMARTVGKELGASLGQPIIVDNVPGAGGTLGLNKAIKAPADGYTYVVSSVELILAPLTFSSAQFKPEDFRTIAFTGRADVMLVSRKDLPASSLAEFVTLLKTHNGKPLSYCTPGVGSLYHLIGESLLAAASVKAVHVPYSGFTQCVNDLTGGTTVDFAFLPVAAPFPGYVENGSIKAIAMLADKPNARFPKVALASATPGFESFSFSVWNGIHVSSKTPEPIVELLHTQVGAALAKAEVRAAIEASGAAVPPAMTLREAQDVYLKDARLYTGIAKSIGLTQK